MKVIATAFLAFVVGVGIGAGVELHLGRQLMIEAQQNADQAAGLEDECKSLLAETSK